MPVKKRLWSSNGVRGSGWVGSWAEEVGVALEMKGHRVKEGRRQSVGLRAKVGVGVTVSKPRERRGKAVNGSSPCLNRL